MKHIFIIGSKGIPAKYGGFETFVDKLTEYKAKNIVVDPVMISTSGSKLLSDDAIADLKEKLLPLADVVTPNIPEAQVLSGIDIENAEDTEV